MKNVLPAIGKLLLLVIAIHPLAALSQQGPYNPTVAENTSCPFSYSSQLDYVPAENVFESDDQYATVSHCDCCDANTKCLEVKNFGFNVPIDAVVNGIMVEIEKHATPGSIVQDNGLQLLKYGTVVGTSYADPTNWPATDTYFTYGGPTDLWGTTWDLMEVNDSTFGVALATISYTCFGNGVPAVSYVDNIRITVFFGDLSTGSNALSLNAKMMTISPNPVTNGHVNISLPFSEQLIQATVTDLSGKLVDEKKISVVAGTANYECDLPAGIYLLMVKGNSGAYVQKMMVSE
jgi:hypothetical protein